MCTQHIKSQLNGHGCQVHRIHTYSSSSSQTSRLVFCSMSGVGVKVRARAKARENDMDGGVKRELAYYSHSPPSHSSPGRWIDGWIGARPNLSKGGGGGGLGSLSIRLNSTQFYYLFIQLFSPWAVRVEMERSPSYNYVRLMWSKIKGNGSGLNLWIELPFYCSISLSSNGKNEEEKKCNCLSRLCKNNVELEMVGLPFFCLFQQFFLLFHCFFFHYYTS